MNQGDSQVRKRRHFCFRHSFICKMHHFYQDRLGTNIGKTQKRKAFSCRRRGRRQGRGSKNVRTRGARTRSARSACLPYSAAAAAADLCCSCVAGWLLCLLCSTTGKRFSPARMPISSSARGRVTTLRYIG
jgi:hypothetical protein